MRNCILNRFDGRFGHVLTMEVRSHAKFNDITSDRTTSESYLWGAPLQSYLAIFVPNKSKNNSRKFIWMFSQKGFVEFGEIQYG